jgi:hypothetical protein
LSQLRARIFRNHCSNGSNGSVSENKALEGTVFCSPSTSEARTQHLPPGPETREFSLRDLVVLPRKFHSAMIPPAHPMHPHPITSNII